MLIIGLVYGLTYHVIIMPLLGSRLILCIIQSVGFGLINYFAAIAIYKKYNVLQKSNTLLQKTLQIDKLTVITQITLSQNPLNKSIYFISYSIVKLGNLTNYIPDYLIRCF